MERTDDEADHPLDLEDLLEDDALRIFNTPWPDVPPKRRSPTPFPMVDLASLLDYEGDSVLEDSESDKDLPSTAPPTAQNKSFQLPLSPHLNDKHPHPPAHSSSCHVINIGPFDTATDGGFDTSADHLKLMPWEEDDCDGDRKELGFRAFG